MATTTGETDLQKLVSKADLILRNCDMYEGSRELEDFKLLLAVTKQKQKDWTGQIKKGPMLKKSAAQHESQGLGTKSSVWNADPRTWQSVEDAMRKTEDEVGRLNRLRFSAELGGLVSCSSCRSTKGIGLAAFPQDLTDSFQLVVDALEPHQRLEELVHSLHKTLRQQGEASDLERLLKEIEAELVDRQRIGSGRKKRVSLMHRAAFGGLESLLRALSGLTGRLSNINARDSDGQTPLHYATIAGQTNAARFLLSHANLRANEEDSNNQTAVQIAVEMKKMDIEKLLMERADVQQYVGRLSSDRQVFVDAANAILVGAALIASVTFGGFLSPPLGFIPYYNFPSPYAAAPPDTFESYAAVEISLSLRVFWALNSLSFSSSLATVIAGAGCVLPMPEAFIKHQVRVIRRWLIMTSSLLVISILFGLGAFIAAGFASLPPGLKYTTNIVITGAIGSTLCVALLIWFLRRLYLIRPLWWRQFEDCMFPRNTGNKKRKEKELYFIS